ncbi:MAG: DUF2169 domain-containing protein [Desulfobacteraceae bacterium]|nr:DUF2169 domain-containing protein [Desulfobacteraceae bacterium]
MDVINTTNMEIAYILGKIIPPDHSMTIIIKGTFDLRNDAPIALSEEQHPPTGDVFYPDDEDMTGAPRYSSDFAYFKPRADLLLAGHCCAPEGRLSSAQNVRFRVGSIEKSLLVVGDRTWKWGFLGSSPSDPEPFSSIELRYENSFGGHGFDKNPVGKGYGKVTATDGKKKRLIPNIVQNGDHLISPRRKLEPAGFGPFAITWPQRRSKLGTYKGDWLKTKWPWFPSDFDWGYYNAAPSDMQVENYLKGNEPLFFENLHPVYQSYQSKLPGLRVRSFLSVKSPEDEGNDMFKEVPMNLDTFWVDMLEEKLILVWRGWIRVQNEELEDVNHLFTVSETVEGAFQPLSFYETRLKELLKAEELEGELEPAEVETEKGDAGIDIEEENAKAEKEYRNALKQQGIDPDAPPPPLSDKAKAEQAKIIKDYGIQLPVASEDKTTRELFISRLKQHQSFDGEDLRQLDLSGLDMTGGKYSESLLSQTILSGSTIARANLKGSNLSDADLSHADLSESDLSNADLTNANLYGANLSGTNLKDAIFTNANLEEANLKGAAAQNADFSKANLKNAVLVKGAFEEAEFSKADLSFSDFTNAVLSEASVRGARGTGMCMDKANLTEMRASDGCIFENCSFKMAIAPDSIWTGAVLTESDFSFCELKGSDFSKTTLNKANFQAAECSSSRFGNASIKEAMFVQTNLFEANLEKTDLGYSNFSGANLYGVEFLEARLDQTTFEGANLKMTKLYKE